MDMKKILQAIDSTASKPVEGSSDMKQFVKIINEGASPHKVSLPVQMTMQHFQKPVEKKTPLLKKYFQEAEEVVEKELAERKEHLRLYSQKIANRIMEKKNGK